jgi:hypothetical protein
MGTAKVIEHKRKNPVENPERILDRLGAFKILN